MTRRRVLASDFAVPAFPPVCPIAADRASYRRVGPSDTPASGFASHRFQWFADALTSSHPAAVSAARRRAPARVPSHRSSGSLPSCSCDNYVSSSSPRWRKRMKDIRHKGAALPAPLYRNVYLPVSICFIFTKKAYHRNPCFSILSTENFWSKTACRKVHLPVEIPPFTAAWTCCKFPPGSGIETLT